MTKLDVPDESTEYEPSERHRSIARRLYRAICAQYPDRLITLCDGDGRVLARRIAVNFAKLPGLL